MIRLSLVFSAFALLLTGCFYPEPEITPIKQTPERLERMKKLRNPDGTLAYEAYEAGRRARREQMEKTEQMGNPAK